MKKLIFANGSVGYRDEGMWLEIEGVPVVAVTNDGVEAVQPAPIENPDRKRYDESKSIKDENASSNNGTDSSLGIR